MALRIVAGRAGSGKTSLCLSEIAAECRREPEGPPLLLITPEQATYETERALVERCEGYVRARVLSFTRLLSVLALEFPGTGLPRLTAIQRTLLVTRAVQRRRAAAPNSQFFGVRGIEESLEAFLEGNPDCNRDAINADLMEFVREIVRADGVVRPEEEKAISQIARALSAE